MPVYRFTFEFQRRDEDMSDGKTFGIDTCEVYTRDVNIITTMLNCIPQIELQVANTTNCFLGHIIAYPDKEWDEYMSICEEEPDDKFVQVTELLPFVIRKQAEFGSPVLSEFSTEQINATLPQPCCVSMNRINSFEYGDVGAPNDFEMLFTS